MVVVGGSSKGLRSCAKLNEDSLLRNLPYAITLGQYLSLKNVFSFSRLDKLDTESRICAKV